MAELLQLIQTLQGGQTQQDVANMVTVLKAHDAEIETLKRQVTDLVSVQDAMMQHQLMVTFLILGLIVAAVAALCWLGVRLDRQVKRILATRIQMKDPRGQLIMDVPLELLMNKYQFCMPDQVVQTLTPRAT